MLIDQHLLDKISAQAKASTRLRMNYNLHDSLESKAQRLLNALEPGTILPIHRHPHTAETYVLLRGIVKVMFYDDSKVVNEECVLNPETGRYGVHIPAGTWHTLEVLQPGSVIFEVKDGPYTPLIDQDILK